MIRQPGVLMGAFTTRQTAPLFVLFVIIFLFMGAAFTISAHPPGAKSSCRVGYRLHSLFALPHNSRLGTLHIDSSLSTISTPTLSKNGKNQQHSCQRETIRSRYLSQVAGGNLSFINPGKKTLAYIQTRRVVLFHFHDPQKSDRHTLEIYRPVKNFQESITRGHLVDENKGLYLLAVQSLQYSQPQTLLRLYELKNEKSQMIRQWTLGSQTLWAVQNDVVFLYYDDGKSAGLQCRSSELEKIEHPVCTYFNGQRQAPRRPGALYVHPHLPFLIVTEHSIDGRGNTALISWRGGKVKYVPGILAGNKGGFVPEDILFSPDGSRMIMINPKYKTSQINGTSITRKENKAWLHVFEIQTGAELFLTAPREAGYYGDIQSYAWSKDSSRFAISLWDEKKGSIVMWHSF